MSAITHAAPKAINAVWLGNIYARAEQYEQDMAKRNLPVTVTVAYADTYIVDNEDLDNHGEVQYVGVTVTIEGDLNFNGYTLAGAINFELDEPLVFMAPGIELVDTPDSTRCDACNAVRYRNKVIVVTDEAGKQIHVGSNCVKDFLGHSTEALYHALTTLIPGPEVAVGDVIDDDTWGGSKGDPLVDFVADATAHITAYGYQKEGGTRNEIARLKGDKGADARNQMWKHLEDMDIAPVDIMREALAAISWAAAIPNDASTFDLNLRAAVSSDVAIEKAKGILTYLPEAYRRHTQAEAEAQAAPETTPVPDTTERITLSGTVVKHHWKDDGYGGDRHVVTLLDDRGFKVWGTMPKALDDADTGSRISFEAKVERSDSDEAFGFFKRPTAGVLL